ncbi:MAG: hypothetical protein ACC642_03920, partial [Pseudomonadales bacterium]
DPATGLLPRRLDRSSRWNAADSAADNYPFMVLTAYITGDQYMKGIVDTILEREQVLTNRVGVLPDDYFFDIQGFSAEEPGIESLIFGASEYAKDGLMPITEWIGPGPWLDRMRGLVDGIWEHADQVTQAGIIPSLDVEVNGELLQTMSRLYWLTGDEELKQRLLRISDHYLLFEDLTSRDRLGLDDHGCEIIGGLSEAYYIVSKEDPDRWGRYKVPMHSILDLVLDLGINRDGLMYEAINPKAGEVLSDELTDNWGYNYNAFLTVGEIDQEARYLAAVHRSLENIHKYKNYKWEAGGADGYADAIEGAINLINRVPVSSANSWIDHSMQILFAKQREDGIIEGWYGDGNSARTALMYALWKTQGVTAEPWREDVRLGAVATASDGLVIYLEADWYWKGILKFDETRHEKHLRMPSDYPRINQFPEWFTVEPDRPYSIKVGENGRETVNGRSLLSYPVLIESEESVLIQVEPTGVESTSNPPELQSTSGTMGSL